MRPAVTITPDAHANAQATTHGILVVLLAWFLLACMDAGSKLLAEEYSIIQILWVRFVLLAAFAYVYARRAVGSAVIQTRHLGLQGLRSLVLVAEIGLFIWVFTILPIASAHAILLVTPLVVTALSVPMLGERVGPRRWAAVVVAFLGVLLILRPGLGVMHPISLVALFCALLFALYQVLTRIVGRSDPLPVTLFYTAALGALGLTPLGPFFWTWPDAAGWALLLLVSFLGGAAHFCLIKGLQLAPAATLQPFSYTILIWATVIGFLVFGNLPDFMTVVGALIVAGSGLYAFARERRTAAT